MSFPPYTGWQPYCLVCNTMERMLVREYGWQCGSCKNKINHQLTRLGTDMKFYVYGSLKQGGWLHHTMEGAKFLGPAVTVDDFMMVDLGSFPGLIKGEGGPIVGELYEGDESLLRVLDRVEGYPTMYDRKVVEVICEGETHLAWVYVYNAQPGRAYKFVVGGVWHVESLTR